MRNRIGRLTILLLCLLISACASRSHQSGSGSAVQAQPTPQQAKSTVNPATPQLEAKTAEPSSTFQPVIENSMMQYPEQADDPWPEQPDEPFQPLAPANEPSTAPEVAVENGPSESSMMDYAKRSEFDEPTQDEFVAFADEQGGDALENDWAATVRSSERVELADPLTSELGVEESLQSALPAMQESAPNFAEEEFELQDTISYSVVYYDHEEDGLIPEENIFPPTVFEEYTEDGVLAEEVILPPTLYEDYAEAEFVPEETISNPIMISEHDDSGVTPEELITGHHIYHDDSGIGSAPEDAISAPRQYAQEQEDSHPEPEPQSPFASPFDAAPPYEEPKEEVAEDSSYAAYVVALAAQSSKPAQIEEAKPLAEPAPSVDKQIPPAPSANRSTPSAPAGEEHLMSVVLSADALFDFGKHTLRAAGKKSLEDFAAGLNDVKWGEIMIVGHTDRLGTTKYNKRLSEQRAQAVKKYLVSKKLNGKKIKVVGKGKTQPVTAECAGSKPSPQLIACLQPDRRVEIFVDEKREVKKVVKVPRRMRAAPG